MICDSSCGNTTTARESMLISTDYQKNGSILGSLTFRECTTIITKENLGSVMMICNFGKNTKML